MALWRHRNKETTRQHRSSLFSLVALIAAMLAMTGCASAATPIPPTSTPTPVPTNTPVPADTPAPTVTPVPEMDIGRQVMEAVQESDLITMVKTTISYSSPTGEEYQQETVKAWLDFPGQRVRKEGWLDGEPSTISVVVDGMEIRYSRDRNQFDEYPFRFFGMSLEEARAALPRRLSNPALYGLAPLAVALVHTQGKLRPAGEGQWQGKQVTVWEADFTSESEGYNHAYTTIYLEPETFRPLGQEVRFSDVESPELPGMTMSVTYQLDFLLPEEAPPRIFEPGRIFHPDKPDPTPLPTAGPPPAPLPTVPASTLPPESAADSSLLRVMEKLPASFGGKGVWFADYARAWEVAGLPPQPSTVEGFLALSEEEREAYARARRGLTFGPNLLGAAGQYAREWEELFGFSGFAVSLAVGTGYIDLNPFGAAYLEADFDAEDFRQRLLELGYREESVSGGTYYAIRGDRDIDPQSFTRQVGALAQMNRVFLAEGALAAGPDTEPIVDVVGAAAGNTPVLSDDPTFSRLAASLRQPLSAALLSREAVLEPDGFARNLVYEKPDEWGDLHQWEALGAGYTVVEGSPWWAISLFYPDPEAAEADAEEIIDRMNGYRTAITRQMYPDMSEPGMAMAAEHPYPISESCASLTPVYTSDESGSALTVWCQARPPETGLMTWWGFLHFRDLGFLLP